MMITGQGNGQGGREHGQKCDQLPGPALHHRSGGARARGRACGASRPTRLPGPGSTAVEIMEAIHAGEIKALLSICFNPLVSLPDANFTREALEKLEFFGVIDFFLSETAHHADVVLAGSLQEEEEGVVVQRRGARASTSRRPSIRPATPAPTRGSSAISPRRLGKGQYFPYREPREIFDELRRGLARRHRRLLRHHLREDRPRRWASSGRARPSTIPARRACSRAAASSTRTARRHFMVTEWRAERRSGGRRLPDLPDHRPRRQPVPLRHADAAHRRAGRSVSRSRRLEIHPRLAEQHGIRDRRLGDGDHAPRRRSRCPAHGGAHHPARHGLHPLPLARRPQRQPADAPHARPAQQDPGVQGLGLPRSQKAAGRAPGTATADVRLRVLRRPVALHRLPGVRERLRGVRHPPRRTP